MAKGDGIDGGATGMADKDADDLRQMVLGALADAGGRDYLRRLAEKSPSAFVALVGKIIPARAGGKDCDPGERREMSDLEVARRLAFLLARGAEALEGR